MSDTVDPRRDQWRRLSILIGVSFIDMLGFFLILPLLPFYALEYHASAEQVGWLIASFSIAQLVAAPIWGRVSDRYGRRPALLIGLSASAIAFLVFGLARSLPLLFISRLVQGAGGGTTAVSQAYVSDSVGPADRARALGWLSAATAAGVMLGPAVGSLATHLGHAAPGFVAAGLCFLNVLAAWRWLPESRRADATPKERKPVWHAAVQVLRHPGGRAERLVWVYGVGMLAFALFTSVLALWLNARFGITEKSIGWFFMATGAMSLVMRSIVLGPVIRRVGELGAMRVGTLIMAVGFALYVVAPSVWWFALLIPALPIGTALLFPATTSLLSMATPSSELGTTMGVAQTFAGMARIRFKGSPRRPSRAVSL
ncbi:MAG TPA: MFS transporter, partial [Gemmatimonadales bacterium]|nr:MFS transporter [Gemmatimonadales bacterium]